MIKITSLTVEFVTPIDKKIVLKDINLELSKNNLVVVIGNSGSGKSTLLDVLSLNNLNFNGTYFFSNCNVKTIRLDALKRKIVHLNQGQSLFEKLSAFNNTKLINSRISISIFKAIADRFGLSRIKNKKIEQLSGGEKQRVGIIRSISKNCELLILDEPTSNLDKDNRSYFINEIYKYKRDRLIIIATHDQELINKADLVLSIVNGELITSKKAKISDYSKNEILTVSKIGILDLLVSDLLNNKKKLFLFISAMSNGILGLLMGFVIVAGFESMFISILVDQVATELSVVYPTVKSERDELNYRYVYLSDQPLIITGDYFNLIDFNSDLLNNSKIDNSLIGNQVILYLNNSTYDKYYLDNQFINPKKISFSYNSRTVTLKVVNTIKSEYNSLQVSNDFLEVIIKNLDLSNVLVKTKVINITDNAMSSDLDLLKIASLFRLKKSGNYITEVEEGQYFNNFDFSNFNNYLICNPSYKIYCDLNAASAYVNLNINGKDMFLKVSNDKNISISSEIHKNLDSRDLKIKFNNDVIIDSEDYSIFESSLVEIKMPYNILVNNLKINYGQIVQAEYLLVNKKLQSNNVLSNYKILSPYEVYLESFQGILDAVFIGFLIYSLVSLLLGIVTVSILIILELDSRRKHIGTLMLLGWTGAQIKIWIIANSIIKTILTILITSIMVHISINTLNVVIKEVTDIMIVFSYPSLNIMLILIISLLLIIGNISLFHVNYLLKTPPKKLINEI